METVATSTSLRQLGFDFFAFRNYVRFELPVLNERIEAKVACPITFARNSSIYVANITRHFSFIIDKENPELLKWAKHLFIPLCFLTSSIERHLRTFHIPTNVWNYLPSDTENIMLSLGRLLDVPPRDSSYSTWLWNANSKYKFDNSAAYQIFHSGVIEYDRQNLKNNDLLRKLTTGKVELDSTTAAALFNEASTNVIKIFNRWKSFMAKTENGVLNITPEYFLFVFRTYFSEYVVGGQIYTGSNAADISSGISFDLITGVVDLYYKQIIIPERVRHFTGSDKIQIDLDFDLPSILDLFLESLGLFNGQLEHISVEDLIKLTTPPSQGLRNSFKAYFELVENWGALFSMHYGMINNYLTKTAKKYEMGCPAGYNEPVVDPLKGTGLMTHEDTKKLADMRRQNPHINKLKKLFELSV